MYSSTDEDSVPLYEVVHKRNYYDKVEGSPQFIQDVVEDYILNMIRFLMQNEYPKWKPTTTPHFLAAEIFNIITSRKYNYQSKKKIQTLQETSIQKINLFIQHQEPIECFLDLGGGYRATTDLDDLSLNFCPSLGELFVLYQIKSLDLDIRKIYPIGVSFKIYIDNGVANFVNHIPYEKSLSYCKQLRNMIHRLGLESLVKIIIESEDTDWRKKVSQLKYQKVDSITDTQYLNVLRFSGIKYTREEAIDCFSRYAPATNLSKQLSEKITSKGLHFMQRVGNEEPHLSFRPFPGGDVRIQCGNLGFSYNDKGHLVPCLITSTSRKNHQITPVFIDMNQILEMERCKMSNLKTVSLYDYQIIHGLENAEEITDFRQTSSCFNAHEINPAIGCDFGCLYCSMYAQTETMNHVPVKVYQDYPEYLSNYIKKHPHPENLIFNYTPKSDVLSYALVNSGISEEIFKVLRDTQVKFYILTKGSIPPPSIQKLLVETRHKNQIIISSGLPNEDYEKVLEPGAPASSERFEFAKFCIENGIVTTGIVAPFLPLDSEMEYAETVFLRFKNSGIQHLSLQILKLSNECLARMCEVLPNCAEKLRHLYNSNCKSVEWKLPGGKRIFRYYSNADYLKQTLEAMKNLAAKMKLTVSTCKEVANIIEKPNFNDEGLAKGYNCVGFVRF